MTTPLNSTDRAYQGQLFNLSASVTSVTTGNPITGGLTSLAAQISKDDGAFAATTNLPVEIGTSGIVSLDLTAVETTCSKIVLVITASNTGAKYPQIQINPEPMAQFVGRFDAQPVLRQNQLLLDLHAFLTNALNFTGASEIIYMPDGSTPKFSGVIQEGDITGARTKMQ